MRLTIIFAIIFFMISMQCFSQEKRHAIGVSYSGLGTNDFFTANFIEGGGNYNGENYFGLGINYLFVLNNTFNLESGIEYGKHKISFTPPFYGDLDLSDSENSIEYNIRIIEIPFGVRIKFLKYLFINSGTIISFDVSNNDELDDQTGLGFYAGVGLQYQFYNKIQVSINPYMKIRSLVEIPSVRGHYKLAETGFKFGLGYLF